MVLFTVSSDYTSCCWFYLTCKEMPGVTKHIFEHELRDILSMWNNEIKSICPLLPRKYTSNDVIVLLKCYYPHEWKSVESKYIYYHTKDKYLKRHFGKSRFNMPKPDLLIRRVVTFKKIFSDSYKLTHWNTYSEQNCIDSQAKLWEIRESKIERINRKIEVALSKTQQVTPSFIDQLMGLYERKNTTQKDKVYILLELKKYYCEKIIQFFFKLNDTELNRQLREEAFFHLQSFNFNPRLRKQQFMRIHAKNKKRKYYLKKVYPNEKYDIPQNPDELEYRIENSNEQKLKSYDYFISHSSKDSKEVQKLICAENQQGKNVFCDWINDVDYLKRHLLCAATLRVIEKRMKQSNALIFVQSENSLKSIWCKYELNYFRDLNRPIFVIDKRSIIDNLFNLNKLEDNWFVDSDYKNLALITGRGIN